MCVCVCVCVCARARACVCACVRACVYREGLLLAHKEVKQLLSAPPLPPRPRVSQAPTLTPHSHPIRPLSARLDGTGRGGPEVLGHGRLQPLHDSKNPNPPTHPFRHPASDPAPAHWQARPASADARRIPAAMAAIRESGSDCADNGLGWPGVRRPTRSSRASTHEGGGRAYRSRLWRLTRMGVYRSRL